MSKSQETAKLWNRSFFTSRPSVDTKKVLFKKTGRYEEDDDIAYHLCGIKVER